MKMPTSKTFLPGPEGDGLTLDLMLLDKASAHQIEEVLRRRLDVLCAAQGYVLSEDQSQKVVRECQEELVQKAKEMARPDPKWVDHLGQIRERGKKLLGLSRGVKETKESSFPYRVSWAYGEQRPPSRTAYEQQMALWEALYQDWTDRVASKDYRQRARSRRMLKWWGVGFTVVMALPGVWLGAGAAALVTLMAWFAEQVHRSLIRKRDEVAVYLKRYRPVSVDPIARQAWLKDPGAAEQVRFIEASQVPYFKKDLEDLNAQMARGYMERSSLSFSDIQGNSHPVHGGCMGLGEDFELMPWPHPIKPTTGSPRLHCGTDFYAIK